MMVPMTNGSDLGARIGPTWSPYVNNKVPVLRHARARDSRKLGLPASLARRFSQVDPTFCARARGHV